MSSTFPFARFFQSAEHQPFSLNGGCPAALLVHGFPGSPAEMRPLGGSLHQAGWSVTGLLLPGFGPDIDTLPHRRYSEWVSAAQQAVQSLNQNHHPVLLVGFSLGAAVAMQAAALQPTDGLVLLAPFIGLESLLWKALPVTRRLFPTIRPFRLIKLDFQHPETRQGMEKMMPGTDWDDPRVQQGVRDFTVPVSIFDEIRQTGKRAFQLAPRLRLPALVVQGEHDLLVTPSLTRRLLQRFPDPPQYLEVPAAHDLPDPSKPAWHQIEAAVLRFASALVESM